MLIPTKTLHDLVYFNLETCLLTILALQLPKALEFNLTNEKLNNNGIETRLWKIFRPKASP